MIDIPDDALICGACGAVLWIVSQKGDNTLMRLGEVEVDDCIQCEKIHEVVA